MIELRRAIQPYLLSIHPRTYFQRAPDTAQFPYLVYRMEVFDNGEGHQRITLDIDGWDRPETGDPIPLETLMATVNARVNKHTITTNRLAVTLYLNSKLPLTDDDPRIHRRRYTYQGRLFERGDYDWL